jgi:hypothetical protein
MIKSLVRGQVVTILKRSNGYEYLREGDIVIDEPLTLHPSGQAVTCTIDICDVVANCDVVLNDKAYITDEHPFVFPELVGGRPRNIVRR